MAENTVEFDEVEVLRLALALACERIGDGPQQSHEAKTPLNWVVHYREAAKRRLKADAAGDPMTEETN